MAKQSKNGGMHPERFIWALIIGIIVLAGIFYFLDLGETPIGQEIEQAFESIEGSNSDPQTLDDGNDEESSEAENETSNDPSDEKLNETFEDTDDEVITPNLPSENTDTDRIIGERDFSRVLPIENELSIIIFDIGQGSSTYVQMPNGKNILIDTGEYEYWPKLKDYLDRIGVKRIDALVGSHPHSDHIGSMQSVIKNFEIGSIYMPKVEHNTKTYENLLRTIRDRNMKVVATKGGKNQTIALDENVTVRILAPLSDQYESLNNYSIALHFEYAGRSLIITADAEALSEKEMLNVFSENDLKSDVMVVGHHGSRTSSSAAFLKAVDPSIAIISLGANNDYGHPHDEIMKRLEKRGLPIYRTDQLGSIAVYFRENGYEVKAEVPY